MCGLFGYARNPELHDLPDEHMRIPIYDLLRYNAARGTDSFGLALIYEDGSMRLIKKALPPHLAHHYLPVRKI
ncbi:MAG: hypothetical protein H0W28_13100, partial [Pyrinomonadaceae bacterium]|nr:hypothetical protein [Pyrinomonadaceae bacterium]